MGGQRWKVVGPSDGGLPVRCGREPSSRAFPERLPLGAVVEEIDLAGECLHFKRLSGLGPLTGWVSIREGSQDLLVTAPTPAKRVKPAPAPVPAQPPPAPVAAPEPPAPAPASDPRKAEQDVPLGGWAKLAERYSRATPPRAPGRQSAAPAATETGAGTAAAPPLDELENASVEDLIQLFGLLPDAAQDFAAMPRSHKRRIIAESKALLAMPHNKRQDALAEIRRAWPKGPLPTFSKEELGPELLPEGCCFPLAREATSQVLDFEERPPEALAAVRRRYAPAAAQKEALRALRCEVPCSAPAVAPEQGARSVDPCRLEGGGAAVREQIAGTVIAKGQVRAEDAIAYLNHELRSRVCLLDGDLVARLAAEQLTEADYRGERYKNFREVGADGRPVALLGNHALLALTRANLIINLHKEFLLAGADVVRTNTFGGNGLALGRYRMQKFAYDINKAAALLAKRAAAEVTKQDKRRPRLVAGVLGPPMKPGATWDALVAAYEEQIKGLMDGGADLLAIEAVADSLAAKAAIFAVEGFFERTKKRQPAVLITAQIDAETGRTPGGSTLEAFHISVKHGRPLSFGLTSAGGPSAVRDLCRSLSGLSLSWCHLCPGAADASPEDFAAAVLELAKEGALNFAGGGAGVLPAHIAALAGRLQEAGLRLLPAAPAQPGLQLAGLEACLVRQADGCQLVGQRCTTMGSANFRRLIDAYKATHREATLREAAEVCLAQCESGADILEVNVDSESVEGTPSGCRWTMGRFLRLCGADPRIARVPFLISSVNWDTIREGLQSVPGKCIVNAICLMLGEEEFLRIASGCKRLGAAVVVLAVGEHGLAGSSAEKVQICQRSYRLLRARLDFPAEDIIFDCQVMPLGTPENAGYGAEFLDAVAQLRRTCPGASFIGGVSNLSLPFRGLHALRDALHSTFLQHAVPQGLNLALVEPGGLPRHDELDGELRRLCEELVLNQSPDGQHLQRFLAFARRAVSRPAEHATAGPPLPSLDELLEDIARRTPAPAASAAAEVLALTGHGQQALALPHPVRPTPSFRRPLETLVQATGTINASIFQTFGSKAHAANNLHRLTMSVNIKRSVLFSSISAYMGQGGSGPIPGASSFLDGIALWERHQGLNGQPITVQWGAIGEIGLRRAIYGSRDVFAQFDLGQKLIGPADTQYLERIILVGNQVPEFLGLAYLDQTWQNTLGGRSAGGGSGLAGRSTFADL